MSPLPFIIGGPAPTTVGTSLLSLRTSVRQRADMENSQFVTDAELTGYIQLSYQELYDILVQKYGDNYFVQTPYTFVTDGTSDQYDLPTDFFKLLGVDLQLTNSPDSFVTLHPFTFAERNRFAAPVVQTAYGAVATRYRINGAQLWLTPRATAGQTVRLWYIPRATLPVNDTDLIDGVSGWEEYVVVDAAIKCLQKEESDVSVLLAQKQALLARIESAAANRDAGGPERVADVTGGSFWSPNDGYGGRY